MPPANNNLLSATALTGLDGTASGDLTGADSEADEATNWTGDTACPTVWYKWTNTSGGTRGFQINPITFTFAGANWGSSKPEVDAFLHTGTPTTFSDILPFIDYGYAVNGFASGRALNIVVPAGKTIYLMITNVNFDPSFYGTFQFDWHIAVPPANDDLANAVALTGTSGSVSGDTTGASSEDGEYNELFSDNVPTVWYKWTNSSGVPKEFHVPKESIHTSDPNLVDAGVAILAWPYTGTPADTEDLIVTNDYDYAGYGADYQDLIVLVAPGDTLYLEVLNDFWDEDSFGTFSFNWLTANGTPPHNTVLPHVVISGSDDNPWVPDLNQDRGLFCYPGTWTGSTPVDLAFQWRRCDAAGGSCVDIAGADSNGYVSTEDDVGHTLRVRVTGSNALGSDTVDTIPSGYVTDVYPTIGDVIGYGEISGSNTIDVTVLRDVKKGDYNIANNLMIAVATSQDNTGGITIPPFQDWHYANSHDNATPQQPYGRGGSETGYLGWRAYIDDPGSSRRYTLTLWNYVVLSDLKAGDKITVTIPTSHIPHSPLEWLGVRLHAANDFFSWLLSGTVGPPMETAISIGSSSVTADIDYFGLTAKPIRGTVAVTVVSFHDRAAYGDSFHFYGAGEIDMHQQFAFDPNLGRSRKAHFGYCVYTGMEHRSSTAHVHVDMENAGSPANVDQNRTVTTSRYGLGYGSPTTGFPPDAKVKFHARIKRRRR